MILVTGAAGKTGRAVIRALGQTGQEVRALIRIPGQEAVVRAAGAQEVVVGDMRDGGALARAVSGASAVYHICPNMHPEEMTIGQSVIAAVATAGVQRFVYHSVLHPQTERMPHHWHKLRVEEQLFESGLSFTILQPVIYMQNLLAQFDTILTQGCYPVPYAPSTRLSFVDLEDVATVAALVLTDADHAGASYELIGSPPLTQTEVAAILSQQIGRTVRVEVIDREQWRRQAQGAGLGDYAIDALLRMFHYYEAYGFAGSTRVLSWLLGREPASLAAFISRSMAG